MIVKIDNTVPNFKISRWVQGLPTNFNKEKDKVVLVEVFQVNCPGCFIYGIPAAINIYNKYKSSGVTVLGIATAFEDFDNNTLENLELLLTTGKVIGETKKILNQYNQLENDILRYRIPFPVAMDSLIKINGDAMRSDMVMDFIHSKIPDFNSFNVDYKDQVIYKVKTYFKSKKYITETFEQFALQGTPSTILVDRNGILRDVMFGQIHDLEAKVENLLS